MPQKNRSAKEAEIWRPSILAWKPPTPPHPAPLPDLQPGVNTVSGTLELVGSGQQSQFSCRTAETASGRAE